jgi:hypothetical protein
MDANVVEVILSQALEYRRTLRRKLDFNSTWDPQHTICKENVINFKSTLMWVSCQCTVCMKYLTLILMLIEQNFY